MDVYDQALGPVGVPRGVSQSQEHQFASLLLVISPSSFACSCQGSDPEILGMWGLLPVQLVKEGK